MGNKNKNTNWFRRYINKGFFNPMTRVGLKRKAFPAYEEMTIPFINDKRIVLTNAGKATGAILSTNLLDSIGKYAIVEGLPIKTAVGLATKESTLGNPTRDVSLNKLLNTNYYKNSKQYLNTEGKPINARALVNYHRNPNPYDELIEVATKKADKRYGSVYKAPNLSDYYDYRNNIISSGERYADKQAKERRPYVKGNVLQHAFRDYKKNPNTYNPKQKNYQQLVNARANEVWNSPEIQNWYINFLRNEYRFRNGGTIHINPANRGKFNATKRRTGKTTEELTHSKNPKTRKRAIFAQNAAKWRKRG